MSEPDGPAVVSLNAAHPPPRPARTPCPRGRRALHQKSIILCICEKAPPLGMWESPISATPRRVARVLSGIRCLRQARLGTPTSVGQRAWANELGDVARRPVERQPRARSRKDLREDQEGPLFSPPARADGPPVARDGASQPSRRVLSSARRHQAGSRDHQHGPARTVWRALASFSPRAPPPSSDSGVIDSGSRLGDHTCSNAPHIQ